MGGPLGGFFGGLLALYIWTPFVLDIIADVCITLLWVLCLISIGIILGGSCGGVCSGLCVPIVIVFYGAADRTIGVIASISYMSAVYVWVSVCVWFGGILGGLLGYIVGAFIAYFMVACTKPPDFGSMLDGFSGCLFVGMLTDILMRFGGIPDDDNLL